jgi:hypothetical protein
MLFCPEGHNYLLIISSLKSMFEPIEVIVESWREVFRNKMAVLLKDKSVPASTALLMKRPLNLTNDRHCQP